MLCGVIVYTKESIQAYEITLKSEADCEEAIIVWVTVRRKGLHRGFSVGIFSQYTLLILCSYYI